MALSFNTLTQSAAGRMAYRPVQKLVHFVRRRVNPDLPVDHAIVECAYGGRRFSIEVHRWSISDRLAIDQCFTEGQYDMPSGAHGHYLERVYREIVASGKRPLIVDCGANIGASVLWLSARYHEAHIVAVEPAPANFALLAKNCRRLDVNLRQAGIGCVDGTAWLSGPSYGGMDCRTNSQGDGIEIEIVSLASLLADKPPSHYTPFMLKVDIEGAESTLFDGDTTPINRFPLIVMEPHDWMLPGQGSSVAFFRFHAAAGREFTMNHENIASVAYRPVLPDA